TAVYTVRVNGNPYTVEVSEGGDVTQVVPASLPGAQPASAPAAFGEPMPAPLAGNIWKVNVTPGQNIQEGDVVLILEAMKMETEVRSPRSGQVTSVDVREGDSVAVGDTLLSLA
nr:biotin/lipoyl-containing protein [Endozoicomonas sp.]